MYGNSHISWCGCYIVGKVNGSHEEAAPVDDFSKNKWDSDGAGDVWDDVWEMRI